MNTDTVLVALDLDAAPEMLLAEARELANKLSAKLIILSVLPVKPSVDTDVLVNPAAHPVAAKQYRDEEARIIPRLRLLAQSVRDAGVDVTVQIAHGDVADCILHVTHKSGAGLIVVGTHGRGGVARFALGSVAESVIRQSPVPVLAVRGGAADVKDRVMVREIPIEDGTTE